MPITGLVIGLDTAPGADRSALEAIAADGRFVIGPAPDPRRVPVVLETPTRSESRRLIEWAGALPGVATIEIAYADFADMHESQEQHTDGP